MSTLRFWTRCAPAALALPVLCGCGGDGGGVVASMPASPVYPTLASGSGTLSASGGLLNFSRAANAPSPTNSTSMPDVAISYNATSQTYTLSAVTTAGSPAVTASYGPAQLQAGIYDATASANGVTTVSRLQVNETTALTYSDIGIWKTGATQADFSQNFNTIYFSYGVRTLASDMPKTGTANYALSIVGENSGALMGGTGTLGANFGAGTVSISLSPVSNYAQGNSALGVFTGTGTISSGASTFASTLAGGSYTGNVSGQFYGPQAAEVGGSFVINSSAFGTVIGAGAFAGKRN